MINLTKEEAAAKAVAWWVDRLEGEPEYEKSLFRRSLCKLIRKLLFSVVWDSADPRRGWDSRRIMTGWKSGDIDPVLVTAARAAKIGQKKFPVIVTMYIDPDGVKVREGISGAEVLL